MIDFNGMSTCLGLFYNQRFGNGIYFMFIFTFFVLLFLSFFACGPIKYKWFANWSIWPIDNTLTGIITLGYSWPKSIGNEGILYTPQISKTGSLIIRCNLVSYPRHPCFFVFFYLGLTSLLEIQSLYSKPHWLGVETLN